MLKLCSVGLQKGCQGWVILTNLSYLARLKKLNLESLELRRIKADLIFMYKMMFNLVDIAVDDMFTLNVSRNDRTLRAHCYQVMQNVTISSHRLAFFSNRIVPVWNSLPVTTNLASLALFKRSICCNYLVKYCKAGNIRERLIFANLANWQNSPK